MSTSKKKRRSPAPAPATKREKRVAAPPQSPQSPQRDDDDDALCPVCGADVAPDDARCPECGAALGDGYYAYLESDPWYSPHYWGLRTSDPSATRMRELAIAGRALEIAAALETVAAFFPSGLAIRWGLLFAAVASFVSGRVARVYGRLAESARAEADWETAARWARIAKFGVAAIHCFLLLAFGVLAVWLCGWSMLKILSYGAGLD